MAEMTVFVIAGGRSSRMGTDKAFLEFAPQNPAGAHTAAASGTASSPQFLLVHMLQLATAVADEVYIVGPAERFAGWAGVVEDIFPDCGPLGGIHAALTATGTDLNLMLAVDLPFVAPAFLRYMGQRAEQEGATITVPRIAGRLHPLCAVYRREFREHAELALRQGHNQIFPLFNCEKTLVLEEAELARLSFSPGMFDNLNTPEDYQRARARLEERRH